MNLIDFTLIAVVGLLCGTMAQVTSRYSHGGWLVHLGVGILGALAGVVIARSVTVPIVYMLKVGDTNFPVIWALIGSVFFVGFMGFLVRPSRR